MNASLTCGTCWNRLPTRHLDTDGVYQDFPGCGASPTFVITGFDPVTHRVLSARPLRDDDPACDEYTTEQKGRELMAGDKSAFDAARRRERFCVIQGGKS